MTKTFNLNAVYAWYEPLTYVDKTNHSQLYADTNILATRVNVAILDSVLGQLSDGIWENRRVMQKYWQGISFLISESNHIIICFNKYLCGASRSQVMKFLATKIKQIVKICIDDGCWNSQMVWKRDCQADCEYLNRSSQVVRISDAYKLYDQLLQRNTNKYHY